VQTGTYMDVTFSNRSNKIFNEIIKSFGLTKDFNDEFHCTIAYSKKPLPNLTTVGGNTQDEQGNAFESIRKIATIDHFGHFDTDEGKNLHVVLKSNFCNDEFNRAINAGATTDYPKYISHVSLMYDCKDFTVTDDMATKFIGSKIEIISERISPLNGNWVEDKTNAEAIIECTLYGSQVDKILLELDETNEVDHVNKSPINIILESTAYGANIDLFLNDL